MSSLLKRHTLVWLREPGWRDAIAALAPPLRQVPLRWQARDWPAVVRRQDADASADQVCLGIALPPDANGVKLRVPLRVAAAEVRELRAPLDIGAVVTHALPAWRAALVELQYKAMAQALDLRVYGSLALQALTGLDYLRASSDIDVLFTPGNRFQLERGVRLLTEYAQRLPLDGEIQFPAGAVAWKEWHRAADNPAARVLLKRRDDVILMRVDDILAGNALMQAEVSACLL